MRNKLALLVVLLFALSAVVYGAIASDAADETPIFVAEEAHPAAGVGLVREPKGSTGEEIYLIRLADAPLAAYKGGVANLLATNPQVSGAAKLDVNSPASTAYRAYLADKQTTAITSLEKALGRSVNVAYRYQVANNGLAIVLTPAEAAVAARQPGVVMVQRDFVRELQTDNGPAWIGAPGLWDGSKSGGLGAAKGEGMIIGVIDTGINPLNPSFAATGDDAYSHTNPLGAGVYVGVCDSADPSYDASFPCNDKLIGARGYATVNGGDPTDYDGHGSHTASTSGGNVVNEAVVIAPTTTITRAISGVAPHANIIAYAACCTGSALSAAIDDAVADGVDVINYSIGSSSPSDVWNDFDTVGYLNARAAGIFVATSAGNDGPGAETVGSPADAPWLTAVAATTHDRKYTNNLVSMTGGDTAAPADISGKGLTAGYGPAVIVYAGDYEAQYPGAALCGTGASADPPDGSSNPFPANFFNGEIVVCDRGTYGRVEKGLNVQLAGAGGYILANNEASGNGLSGDAHFLPGLHITYDDGVTLKAWLASGTGHMATISGATLDIAAANGDIMASFSSRGANRALPDLIAPSIGAPGVDILAAYGSGGAVEWGMISGTSMASPHIAGAAALLMQLHPTWTPAEIQSAMMTTSWTDVFKEDGVTAADPFDYGAGRVDLNVAANAGLLLDESISNYQDADPGIGGDPKTLNLASMGNASCVQTCSWTRTFKSSLAASETWTTTLNLPAGMSGSAVPASFTIAPGATQVVTVTVDVLGLSESWYFGTLELTPSPSGGPGALRAAPAAVPAAHLPIAVHPNTGDLPALVEIEARRDAGSQLLTDLTAIEITDLNISVYGLAAAEMNDFWLHEDPTNDIGAGEMYDDLSQVWYRTIAVPAGAARVVAQVVETTSPDVDMAVGFDTNGDGLPSADEEICSSASGGSAEYCDVTMPGEGTWWVAVMVWEASVANEADSVRVATGVVASDAGNMWLTGPTAVAALDPFDLRLFWDDMMATGDYWYGAFTVGTDAGSPGNVGFVPVNLYRVEDDVTKTVSTSSQPIMPGDTLTYKITVLPNTLAEDQTYQIVDAIPDGLTYVPNSATATSGNVLVGLDTVFWTGSMVSPRNAQPLYNITTSATDPNCDTPFGGYVDLQGFNISANSNISGDTSLWTAFATANPVSFYGEVYSGYGFTDDGFLIFDPANNYGGAPWTPQLLPDSAYPNNVAAIMWNDFEIFYDGTLNHGVTLATAGPDLSIVEYDNIQFWGGSSTQFDFESFVFHTPSNAPGDYEIIFAYDNISGTLNIPYTIGMEDAAGGYANAFLNKASADGVISDGFVVCFDFASPLDAVEITYQVTVDTGVLGIIENGVVSSTNNVGSRTDRTQATVFVGYVKFMPVWLKD